MQIRGMVLIALLGAACSGAPPSGSTAAPPVAKEEPGRTELPATPFVPGGTVRVDNEDATFARWVAAGEEPEFEALPDLDQKLAWFAELRGAAEGEDIVTPPWPASTPCGGATAETYPTHVHAAVRAGAPRDGDLLVVVPHDVALLRGLTFALYAGRPAVLAIEEADGARQILPIRLCADQAPPPLDSARTIEIVVAYDGPSGGLYLTSAGGVAGSDRHDVDHLPLGAGGAGLGEAIRAAAYGETPALVRLWMHARLPIAEVEPWIAGVLAADPDGAAIVGEQRDLEYLSIEPGKPTATGDVDRGVVGAELRARRAELASCAERAAYADPGLAELAVTLVYAGARPHVSLDPPLDEGSTGCFEGVLGAIEPQRRDTATGSATFLLTVKRTSARGP